MALRNIEVKAEGKKAVLTVDLSKEIGPSASGKTTVIATTSGAHEIAPGIIANITIYKKAAKA
jgi:ABC-type polar amino acid transport system ATPase subunit